MNKCSLMKIMNEQIIGDHYNNPILWEYERLNDIASHLNLNIDLDIHRQILAIYLKYIYKPFNNYLVEKHPNSFIKERNHRFRSNLEYHALHEYLKINNFTLEYVNKFIEIDNNDRTIFKKYRDYAECRYFCKISSYQLNYSDYDSNKFNRYKYKYYELELKNDLEI